MATCTFTYRSCFLFRTISSANIETKQFLRPLNIKVWYVVLATMIVGMSILAWLLVKQEGVRNLSEGYSISVLLTIGAVSQQGFSFLCFNKIFVEIFLSTLKLSEF